MWLILCTGFLVDKALHCKISLSRVVMNASIQKWRIFNNGVPDYATGRLCCGCYPGLIFSCCCRWIVVHRSYGSIYLIWIGIKIKPQLKRTQCPIVWLTYLQDSRIQFYRSSKSYKLISIMGKRHIKPKWRWIPMSAFLLLTLSFLQKQRSNGFS